MKLVKLILCISISFLLSCSKEDEPINLVCEGIETTNLVKFLVPYEQLSKPVIRTIRVFKDNRDVIRFKDTEIKTRKIIWVINIDNEREIGEYFSTFSDKEKQSEIYKLFENEEKVEVNENEINGKKTKETEYHSGKEISKNFEKYSLKINRLSGEFREELNMNPTNTEFLYVTTGSCKKSEKKF